MIHYDELFSSSLLGVIVEIQVWCHLPSVPFATYQEIIINAPLSTSLLTHSDFYEVKAAFLLFLSPFILLFEAVFSPFCVFLQSSRVSLCFVILRVFVGVEKKVLVQKPHDNLDLCSVNPVHVHAFCCMPVSHNLPFFKYNCSQQTSTNCEVSGAGAQQGDFIP